MHALAVTDDDELFESVRRALQHSHWQLHRAGSLEEVARLLEDEELRDKLAVALCGPQVKGGCGWHDLLTRLRQGGSNSSVVVVDRSDSQALWKDVLEAGGYELLRFPLDQHELFRVITQAWRQWRGRKLRRIDALDPADSLSR